MYTVFVVNGGVCELTVIHNPFSAHCAVHMLDVS